MPDNRQKTGQFAKGRSGNPGGRPKKNFAFQEALLDWLQTREGGQTRLQGIIERLAKDDPKVLLHYAFGKPVEVQQVTTTHVIDPKAIAIAQKLAEKL